MYASILNNNMYICNSKNFENFKVKYKKNLI